MLSARVMRSAVMARPARAMDAPWGRPLVLREGRVCVLMATTIGRRTALLEHCVPIFVA